MTDEERIVAAWDKAQVAFRAMLVAKSYGDPEAPETRAYTKAEANLDAILFDVMAGVSASPAHDPECDCHHIARQQLEETMRAEAEGDHFAYPAGGR